jgi:general secretion pathway protein D
VGAGNIAVNPNSISPAGRYSIVGNSFSAILQSLATDNRFNILSTPRIFTANNREAQINISQRIPYVTGTVVTTTGATQTNVDYIDVGIILDVVPRITSNGLITIDVSPTANDFQGFTDVDAPLVAQRSTQTTVVVQDGQTVIIGGLIRDTVTKNRNKVPILGDIPIIGSLFRSKDTQRQKTELMVFLTPHVVRTSDEISDLTERQKNQLQYTPPFQLSRPAPAPPVTLPPVNPGPSNGQDAQPGAADDPNTTDPNTTEPNTANGGETPPAEDAGSDLDLPAPPDAPGAGEGAPPAPAAPPVESGAP